MYLQGRTRLSEADISMVNGQLLFEALCRGLSIQYTYTSWGLVWPI